MAFFSTIQPDQNSATIDHITLISTLTFPFHPATNTYQGNILHNRTTKDEIYQDSLQNGRDIYRHSTNRWKKNYAINTGIYKYNFCQWYSIYNKKLTDAVSVSQSHQSIVFHKYRSQIQTNYDTETIWTLLSFCLVNSIVLQN